ncbi:hypothetical protein EVAR_94451_1 [Eumeta japonica]|uniref:Uncharacterized protein n=1 Tax=Eumeta variegata TaxID=151549 RepID=A0A4C1ZQK0_EUMVA|nr:hypothetical protein EVAR_94451_1 [Eumeta japonica]
MTGNVVTADRQDIISGICVLIVADVKSSPSHPAHELSTAVMILNNIRRPRRRIIEAGADAIALRQLVTAISAIKRYYTEKATLPHRALGTGRGYSERAMNNEGRLSYITTFKTQGQITTIRLRRSTDCGGTFPEQYGSNVNSEL